MSEVLERPSLTMDNMIANYVRLRDKKQEIERRHAEELAPYKDIMGQLEAYMMEAMNQAGLNSMKSPHGTAFKQIRTSATVKDWDEFLAFVREREAWDLLERRVAKKAAEQVIEDTKAPVPGVETSREWVVNVRRPTDSAKTAGK